MDGIVDIAVNAAKLCRKLEQTMGNTQIRYEYSPESFTLTEPEFAIRICEAVMDVVEPTPEQADHPQPAGDGRVLLAQRVRRRDRVVRPHDSRPRLGRRQPAPAQRPRLRRRGRRVRSDGRRRSRRGNAVRQRRAHRQRRHRQPGDEPVQQRRRSGARHHRHRRVAPRRRVLQSPARAPASPVCRRSGVHVVQRQPPGRDQEGLRGAARRTTTSGAFPTCRSIRSTSVARTRRSSGSTHSPARVASRT